MANDKPTFANNIKKFGTVDQQQKKLTKTLGVSPNPSKISQQAAASTTQNKKIPVTQVSIFFIFVMKTNYCHYTTPTFFTAKSSSRS